MGRTSVVPHDLPAGETIFCVLPAFGTANVLPGVIFHRCPFSFSGRPMLVRLLVFVVDEEMYKWIL